MITDADPLRGLLFYSNLDLSHAPHVLKSGGWRQVVQEYDMDAEDAGVIGALRGDAPVGRHLLDRAPTF